MASAKLFETKDGKRYWRIQVSRGKGQSPASTRFYWQDGWSQKTAEKAMLKASAKFEEDVKSGKIETRKERKQREEADRLQAEAEALKLKTVRQYAEGVFLREKETTFSKTSLATYKMFFEKVIFPNIGDMPLTEVNTAMLRKIITDYQNKGYSHATIVKLYNILNGLFGMAFLDDSISINPMQKVKRPSPRKDEAPINESDKAYTVEEVRNILQNLENEPLKWRVYISLMLDTGARRGELCGLYWDDIDFSRGTITIKRNLQYTPESGIYEASPKNGKVRNVDIGERTIVLLREYKAIHDEQYKNVIPRKNYVFMIDGSLSPMHPTSPTHYFRQFGSKYGIKDFHPHKLRHTSASLAITNGADVVSVSQRLGHSDTAVTLRMYAHANEESIRRAGEIVRNLFEA